jgi:hypothetical protein
MRSPNPIRNVRQNIEFRDEAASRTAYLEDEVYKQALEQLLPQIAAESEQASKPVRQVFHYYRRKRSGRRCSCFEVETSPDGFCQICFGSGFVGGWDLHGCRTEVIDVTSPNLKLVNVEADFSLGVRPTPFTLKEGYKKGYIETELEIVRSVKVVQALHEYVGQKRRGTSTKLWVRRPTETAWVELTEFSLAARLDVAKLHFRIELERHNTGLPSPQFSHLFFRYQLIPDVKMYGDMNLAEESFELGQLGFTDAFSTLNLYVSRNFDHLRMEDFLIRLSDQKRFFITRIERNAPLGVLLSHRIMGRLLIVGQDSLVRFP